MERLHHSYSPEEHLMPERLEHSWEVAPSTAR